MEVIRYKYIFVLTLILQSVKNEPATENVDSPKTEAPNCPFTKIIEDIFKIHNKTSYNKIFVKDSERAKIFLNTLTNVTRNGLNKTTDEELVNDIIASINRIKNTANDNETEMNEAIILNVPIDSTKSENRRDNSEEVLPNIKIGQIKSGMEEKVDVINSLKTHKNITKDNNIKDLKRTDKPNYVEILTIEPNNTNANITSKNDIIEALKHLMPMFNSTLTKELHNITVIERNYNKNHSFSATKNVSTIVVTFCDKENMTKINKTFNSDKETYFKLPLNDSHDYDYFMEHEEAGSSDNFTIEHDQEDMTFGEKKDILEAAEYGMQKMHELYSVLEPKLYSMGLWLDDKNPARYVAAFNAPTEDAARYSRYGYASLQAATRLRQLTNGGNEDGLEGRTEDVSFPSASALRQSPLLQHCPNKGAPKCPPASKRYRTHDGTCNNLNRPRWGSTMTPVQRFLSPSYSDGLQAPRRSVLGGILPSAREISARIHEDQNVESPGITHLLMQWGQFLDHDITSSSQSRGFNGSVPRCCKDGGRDFVPQDLLHPECFPIAVPPSDQFYGPLGVRCLDFVRSSPAPRDDCALGWREQINQVSAYIDGSPLYASSARQSDKLRLFRNGMLQYGRVQQRRPILPHERQDELCRGGAVSTDCFKSGDGRVNEHPGLVAAHIVWLRQHNRMAQELAHLNPQWSDEKIYQETRKIVGAMIQHITYREFLPIVLGQEVMRLFELEPLKKGYYRDYNPKVNSSPASSFGSAAFRFGHSLVQPSMVRFDRFHRPMDNNVSLHDELTNPSNIWSMGAVDRLLLGMVNQPIQKRDEFITEELTNHLFQTPHFNFGMDLAAINIQRGRDHGVPPYTEWREPCGLTAIVNFGDLFRVMPARVVRKLQFLYRNVDDIDLFTGGMAERPVVGGLVGPTFACIIAQQFSNLRKGDRFWYENGGFDSSFTPAQLQQIRRISFAQVLCHTLDNIDNIQPFVFLSSDNPDNQRISCKNGHLNNFDLSPWIEINSESNDISKSDNTPLSTENLKSKTTIKPTTTTRKTNKLVGNIPNKTANRKPQIPNNSTKPQNVTKGKLQLNKTDTLTKDKRNTTTELTKDKNVTKQNTTVQIDDKLDFKNKSRRFDDTDNNNHKYKYNKPTNRYNDYDDDTDNVQSVQSVLINNLPNKRPYNRPIITVTENVNKYTYLINYVPRPTQSWRQTTKKSHDRDVVKVTYQTYDDTYRRPNNPNYYNKDDQLHEDLLYRNNRPHAHVTDNNFHSSARSNDDNILTTIKPKVTDKHTEPIESTTLNPYKLVTFGYIGTYRGSDMTNDDSITKSDLNKTNITTTDNNNKTRPKVQISTDDKKTSNHKQKEDLNQDTISKDFSTYETNNPDLTNHNSDINRMKLSTFYHYETVTRPYNLERPTRRNDESPTYASTKNKYYYVSNILHKYPDTNSTMVKTVEEQTINAENNKPRHPVNVEERSSPNKMAFLDEIESKSANPDKFKDKLKKPTGNAAKTPSVSFQIIPSENSPTNWAIYEETDLLEDVPHNMPTIKADPYALREIPRPMEFNFKKRRPGV